MAAAQQMHALATSSQDVMGQAKQAEGNMSCLLTELGSTERHDAMQTVCLPWQKQAHIAAHQAPTDITIIGHRLEH